jgi:hypothetical protein
MQTGRDLYRGKNPGAAIDATICGDPDDYLHATNRCTSGTAVIIQSAISSSQTSGSRSFLNMRLEQSQDGHNRDKHQHNGHF